MYIYTLQLMYYNRLYIVDPLMHASPHVCCTQAKDRYVEPSHVLIVQRITLHMYPTYFQYN